MNCGSCGSKSGTIEYSQEGRKFFHCECGEFTVIDNRMTYRMERDVG